LAIIELMKKLFLLLGLSLVVSLVMIGGKVSAITTVPVEIAGPTSSIQYGGVNYLLRIINFADHIEPDSPGITWFIFVKNSDFSEASGKRTTATAILVSDNKLNLHEQDPITYSLDSKPILSEIEIDMQLKDDGEMYYRFKRFVSGQGGNQPNNIRIMADSYKSLLDSMQSRNSAPPGGEHYNLSSALIENINSTSRAKVYYANGEGSGTVGIESKDVVMIFGKPSGNNNIYEPDNSLRVLMSASNAYDAKALVLKFNFEDSNWDTAEFKLYFIKMVPPDTYLYFAPIGEALSGNPGFFHKYDKVPLLRVKDSELDKAAGQQKIGNIVYAQVKTGQIKDNAEGWGGIVIDQETTESSFKISNSHTDSFLTFLRGDNPVREEGKSYALNPDRVWGAHLANGSNLDGSQTDIELVGDTTLSNIRDVLAEGDECGSVTQNPIGWAMCKMLTFMIDALLSLLNLA